MSIRRQTCLRWVGRIHLFVPEMYSKMRVGWRVALSGHSGGPSLYFVSLCWCKQINLAFIRKLLATINNLITECWVNNSATKFKTMETLHDAKSAAITVQLVAGARTEEKETKLWMETVKAYNWKARKNIIFRNYSQLMHWWAASLSPDGALECVWP